MTKKLKSKVIFCFLVMAVMIGAFISIPALSNNVKAESYDGIDYSSVYDFEYYESANADVASVYGDDENAVFHHFLDFGMDEGRVASATFNVSDYKSYYSDLDAAFGNDLKSYYIHYINCGKNEGRSGVKPIISGASAIYNGVDYSSVYDFDFYESANPDVAAAYGDDKELVFMHFLNCGMNEGRVASASFNILAYKAQNNDLRVAFGNDLKSYYEHYIKFGKNEGRSATGNATITNGITIYDGVDYSDVYNFKYYLSANPDVAAAFGSDDIAVLKHFLDYGMSEGRVASESFNVEAYKNQNFDLRKAFRDNKKEYYLHFINNGKDEGRSGEIQPLEWTVTQYGDDAIGQYMFYTIADNRGNLVLVDGGYKWTADAVKEVIEAYDYHVNAWIITHPHPDHVGAFNEIIGSNYGSQVKIDTIYTVPVNAARYEATTQSSDSIEYYENFYALTKNMANVKYLQAGNKLNLIGLDMKVFNAWNSTVDKLSSGLCNNGSLMFKISSPNNSMLFCADVESKMQSEIIANYGNELKSDYVQTGHHGNWGLTTGFYDLVNPKVAFFDAPTWLIDEEHSSYDGYLLRNYFMNKGVRICRFSNTPNSVTMK